MVNDRRVVGPTRPRNPGGEPLVSVVVPVFNAASTVVEAIESILSQTCGPLEVVIVDDGSQDESVQVVRQIKDTRVVLLRQQHRGVVSARNIGCAAARGEFIAPLDADDLAHQRRLAMQVAYLLEHPMVGLVGTWALLCHEGGGKQVFTPPAADAALRRYLLWDNPFIHSSVMFRREAFRQAGGYPPGTNEDYRLWVRIARRWQIAVVPEVLVTHRVRSTSLSRTMPRAAALRARLVGQWEAARLLGPWWQAAPALMVTGVVYLAAVLGAGLDGAVGQFVRRIGGRWRGISNGMPRNQSP